MSKGRRGEAFGDQKEKEDEGAEDLRLIPGWSAGSGVKRQKEGHCDVGIKKQEFLPGIPKLGMEPGSLRRIERNFRIMEKTFVIQHGLPVFDHSAGPPCKKVVVEYYLITRAHLVTAMELPNAPHNSGEMSIVLRKLIKNAFWNMEESRTEEHEKRAENKGFLSFRDRS